jgi:hypothetical protein
MTAWRMRLDAAYLTVLIIACAACSLAASSYAAHRATAAAVTTAQLCASINDTRARQVTLWEHLITTTTGPRGETPQARGARLREDAAVLAYVERVFAPANCHRTGAAP